MCIAINQLTTHVIVCGTVAAWWLTPNDSTPIGAAASRACRYSFGSISLAAFLITVFEAVELLLGFLCDTPCLSCLWNQAKKLFKLYSSYTLVRVAVFNESFCSSASRTNELFVSSGLDAVTNDTFVWAVLYLGSWVMGAVHGLVTVLIWSAMVHDSVMTDMLHFYLIWILGLWIGKNMTMATLMPIDSAIRTTFVLWSEASPKMLENRPDQMQPILDGYRESPFYTVEVDAGVPMQQQAPVQGQQV